MKTLAILGASGHGKVLADIAILNGFDQIHFFDDRFPELTHIEGWKVVGNTQIMLDNSTEYTAVIVGIGHNRTRLAKQQLLEKAGANIAVLVHPTAAVSQFASVKFGSVIMAGAVVNAFANIGKAAVINTSATVDHDCDLGDGVHISPGANLAGAVTIGECSWVGIGACVIQYISIGYNVVIGAGSTVIAPLPDNTTAVGAPARPIASL